MNQQGLKKALIVVHDLVVTGVAVLATFYVRFDGSFLYDRLVHLPLFLPPFVAFAGVVYWFSQLYKSKWRFASLPDLFNIFRAATILAVVLLVVDYLLVSPQLRGTFFFGKITIALYWLIQMFLLGGPRLAFRYMKYARSRHTLQRDASTPTLLLGRGSDIEVILRAIEAGTVKKTQPKGILTWRSDDVGQSMRGVPVLGTFADLDQVIQDFHERGTPIRRLLATPSALMPEAHPDMLLARARRLGLPLVRVTSLGEGMRDAELAPLEIEDLLLRPTVQIDRKRLENFIRGKRVLVTGGGGSIGSEICTRVVAFGASDLMILESSEPSLHHILENPTLLSSDTNVDGVIADVRDRDRVREVMNGFQPEVVFHAAALKHVPYLEKNWTEGVKTNVFGSVNVADAAVEAGADTIVMISTDKAIDPVSMLGATKRFAEMYGQALDAEFMGRNGATRIIAVRFGNVLGSVGSVVPKFKAQIARGGPLTVTHPDMVRYFMTTREAADLVLTSASHAEESRALTERTNGDERASVYVLKMGQPVKIYELAERMIRLAGYEPGEDIEIQVTGTRPGERLHEILFAREEPRTEIGIDGVMAAKPIFADRDRVDQWLQILTRSLANGDRALAEQVFEDAIPEFKRRKPAPQPAEPVQQARLASS
ncbi:nucleoside-diphosphate sugar epimerase/dehydratase [Microvirga lotononidis]|uniref:Putative nucleoside-diphosphate sugar epimerase n=1 Tax=Microvirga lotononidis TaxID=864069 RepID=I4YZA2_9HYPH|nr:nucleoside-diphosphate sugar epimerase/dehydratase [Microvirga lotononidis]EIM29294.1 putative nucleoside-diphosphate sugar epimerase [Microvirga lotononidis]WQO29121.1 nucleoside-diphosphate sugar epimerase/dehydratase [Microvirga lotononidis]